MAQEIHSGTWNGDPNWYRSWFDSDAYHVLYGHRSEEEAQRLVSAIMDSCKIGVPTRVLDAGCGAGRHARAMGERGCAVDAFDLSASSLERARQLSSNNSQAVNYHQLDLREIATRKDWSRQFDLVTNFFTSMGYFSEDGDFDKVIDGFRYALRPNGFLLIDYLNVEHVAANLVPQECIVREGVKFEIHRRIENGWIEKSIAYDWEGESFHHVERVQALSRSVFQHLLVGHGFNLLETWGDYDLSRWEISSPRLMLLAQLKNKQITIQH